MSSPNCGMSTVAPVAVKLPSAVVRNDPLKVTAAPLAVIVPPLDQFAPPKTNVCPAGMVIVPLLTTDSLAPKRP